jgi:hypothetical protein
MAARAQRKGPVYPPGVQSAVDYADAVIAGTVDAGRLVHLACERFRLDMDGDTWEFRPELAERAMDFAGQMPNEQAHREACPAWNRAVETVPGWPQVQLRVLAEPLRLCPARRTYPASFATDLQAYLDHLAGNDLFVETARQPASPLTIHDNRLQLLEIAAALVLSGWAPASIGRLADLIEVEAARTALKFFWEGKGKRKTEHLHRVALLMVKLAKHWVKVPPEHLEALRQQLRKQVNPGTAGMTARNRALLRQIDPATRLVNLPRKLRDACRPKAGHQGRGGKP